MAKSLNIIENDKTIDEQSSATSKKGSEFTFQVSVYMDGDRVVSAIAIQNENTVVKHVIPYKKVSDATWMGVVQAVNKGSLFGKETTQTMVNEIVNSFENIGIPQSSASGLKNIGKLVHKIVSVKVTL